MPPILAPRFAPVPPIPPPPPMRAAPPAPPSARHIHEHHRKIHIEPGKHDRKIKLDKDIKIDVDVRP
jgi:hypothetical protein